MRRMVVAAGVALCSLAIPARGQQQTPAQSDPAVVNEPFKLMVQDQSVYALPSPLAEEEGVNAGGIKLDAEVSYFTDYIYRGVDQSERLLAGSDRVDEDAANFQFAGRITFDLGKFPSPFIGVFTNVLESDPVSNFQEFRPIIGAELKIRPLILSAGHNLYQFPDRDELNTAEVWGQITLDDAAVFRTEEPFLSPYIFAAYDYDEYSGWYIEAGVKHDFRIEGTGITLTVLGNVAYVYDHPYFTGPSGEDTGFQHYEVGLIGTYSLNTLLNIPQRYGTWSLRGYAFYTDNIDNDLAGDTDLYGGAGIQLSY